MGRSRKRFNEKARQSQNFEVHRGEKEKIEIDINVQKEKYDLSNPLVIYGKKENKSKGPAKEISAAAKPLSKKERKRLTNILAKKKKKLNRVELLEKLSKVQAKPEDLTCLTSTASMQTYGIKKLNQQNSVEKNLKISNIKGSRKHKNLSPKKREELPPNVVGFEGSSSSSDDDMSESEDKVPEILQPIIEDLETQREELVEKLSSVQTDADDLRVTSIQTHGTKRLLEDDFTSTSSSKIRKKKKITENCENTTHSDASFVENPPNVDGEGPKDIKAGNDCDTEKCSKQETSEEITPSNVAKSAKSDTIVAEESKKQIPTDVSERLKAVFVPLSRLPEMQAAREALPIFCEEQAIMEAIRENPVVVIHGETGSGKTTQVPQFLYEGGYAQNKKIVVTEPRRIAAMTMAARVGKEMNLPDVVAYHVRYENSVKEETKITFMTDGVLLKEIKRDFYLSKYSVVIVDEAHERSVFSDVLIGLLSRIVPLREKKGDPLKLIIMSATMRVEEFTENARLFKEPPFLIRLDSRQYKVDVHFNIHTPDDYVEAAFQKVCKIHTQLPSGAILVFLTGEKEITKLCKMLRNRFPFKDSSVYTCENMDIRDSKAVSSVCSRKKKKKQEKKDTSFCSLPKIDLDDFAAEPLDNENLQHQLSDEEGDSHADSVTEQTDSNYDQEPLYTLPLYSILPFQEQQKVFQPPPPGSRLCVVSTNVAETSITIPGLKYVVDSGRVKTKVYNKFAGGISHFCIEWTSKASANQRAGRAGRTEGGHCYRLYSSSIFQHEFLDFSPPEIQRIPVDDVLLQLKALGIPKVVSFPFPSPPDPETLKSAERRLVLLGALEDLNSDERRKSMNNNWEYSAKITEFGKAMARFPLSPRYAKMLILSYKHQCIPYIAAIVSAMTVPEIFLPSNDDEDSNSEQNLLWKGLKNTSGSKSLQLGDIMVLLRAVASFEESKNKVKFCIKNRIRHKAMVEVHKMCTQLLREMNRNFKDLAQPLDMELEPPNDELIEKLRKIVTSAFTDHVARLLPQEEMKLNKNLKNAYKCLDLEEPVFIHPSSVLFSELPQYVIYQEIVHTSKYYMKGVVEINPEWLGVFAPAMCKFSDPLEEPPPSYDSQNDQILCFMNCTYGPWQWELSAILREMPTSGLKYTWFSFFLLDGQVYNFFKHYKKHLVSSPSTLLKSWARSLPRIRYLLHAVWSKQVDSKESLQRIWEKEPTFLLREYKEWLAQEKHIEVECKWPPKT